MAVLGFRCCARAFSSCGKQGPLFITVRGPLTIAASLVEEHRLQTCRLSSCGTRAQLLHSMWDLPRPGLEPVSPALAGRFSTTAPPGKPSMDPFNWDTWGLKTGKYSCIISLHFPFFHFLDSFLNSYYWMLDLLAWYSFLSSATFHFFVFLF